MLKVLSLRDFQTPNFSNNGTASYINDELLYYSNRQELHQECQLYSLYLRDFPSITITPEVLATRECARTIAARDLFLPVQDSAFKKIVSIWRERGIIDAIKAAAAEDENEITKPVHWIATKLACFLDFIEKGTFLTDPLPASGTGSVAEVAATRDWTTALVRCIAWHPHCLRIAISTRDDRIRIYSNGNLPIAVLRHNAQKSVCCMKWRPHAGRELAAACETGVLVWTIELGAASNSLSHAILLQHRNHAPVTSVAWHPEGDILVSASLADLNMIVWHVSKEMGVPIRRVGGGGLCFTVWSHCGSRLFASTCRTVFRIWNIGVGTPWEHERWYVPNGRVAATCFGPNLSLLFTSTENPAMIFSLPLQEQIFDVKKIGNSGQDKIAIPLIDLSVVTFVSDDGDEEVNVGGRVISMEWDPVGKYLAVMFQDSPLIAVFKTKVGAVSRITEVKPLCLIKGLPGEVPNCIQFYQNHRELKNVSYLTIAWSSGFVQHFPFVDSSNIDTCKNLTKTCATMSNTFGYNDDNSFYTSFE